MKGYSENVFMTAVKWWEDNTCITFIRNDDANNETDDVIFVTTDLV